MKQPAFQFYAKDWTSNQKLRRCSEAARGAWISILCLLHDSEEYGVARFPLTELTKAAAVTLKSARELVAKGVLKGGDRDVEALKHTPKTGGKPMPEVTLLDASSGPMWYSSRMVRDEWARARKGLNTRFNSDNQPSREARQGEPQGSAPSRTPNRVEPQRQGDGPAVAVAVAVDLSTASTVAKSIPEPEPAPPEAVPSEPQVNPETSAKIIAECTRAGITEPELDPIVARWIRNGVTPTQVINALAEAPFARNCPKPMTAAYADPILERLMTNDRRTRTAAQARIEATSQRIADQQALPPPSPIPEALRKLAKPAVKSFDDIGG